MIVLLREDCSRNHFHQRHKSVSSTQLKIGLLFLFVVVVFFLNNSTLSSFPATASRVSVRNVEFSVFNMTRTVMDSLFFIVCFCRFLKFQPVTDR